MGQKVDTPDFSVARIAGRQHGVLARRQLEAAGLGARAIRNRVARDLDLRSAGFTVLRFTDAQLEKEPARVVADLARALGTGGSRS